ncbi:MAG: hypothetical protein NTAFB05_23600 [Nitrobacter sp.]|uniref:DUF1501 domain-containing protein n=1 Tax=Nitrobacter sp. TaxID=29420 RepID=UPI00387DF57D
MQSAFSRRTLLKALAALAPATVAGRVWAAPQTQARLLVVFLRGAYDAANVVIPIGSNFYYQSRPTLAVPRPGSNPAKGAAEAIALDGDWGLHPALRASILPLWQKKQIAFVPFAGTDDLTRSHFETQDTIELGQPVNGSRNYQSGFMARLAGVLTQTRPIAFTDQLPLIFHGGETPIPNIGLNTVGKPAINDRQAALIAKLYEDDPLFASVAEGFHVRDDVYQSISRESVAANRHAVSPKGFELSARRIARLMRGGYNLGFVDVGGWDTHVNQGGSSGYLADRLTELGRGLAGFADETGPEVWRDTVVVVISEFGRTFRENGDKGTDHGHGSVYWVLGGGVRGGRIVGEQVKVAQATLFQNRDYPVLTDYRALFGGLLRRMYGLDQVALQKVFADVQPKDMTLV